MPRHRQDRDGIYERPNSPYYWASYVDAGGERVSRSTGIQKSTEGRKEAEALIAKGWLEVHRQKQWDEQPEHSFDELMLACLQGPSTEKRAAERDRYSAKRLYAFFSGRSLQSLTASDMRAYINKRKADGVQVGTINREIGLLSTAMNWARRELDWDIANPAQGRRLREPVGRVRWITRDEAQKLLEAAAGIARATVIWSTLSVLDSTPGCVAGRCWDWNGDGAASKQGLSTWRPVIRRMGNGESCLSTAKPVRPFSHGSASVAVKTRVIINRFFI